MRDDFCLGDWLVQPRLVRVSRGDRTIHLRARAMDLLVFFADHPGQVLSRDTLLEEVWGAKFVAESSLTTAISEIRQAFEDDAREPWLIDTIPKRGYRLIAPRPAAPGPPATIPPARTAWPPLRRFAWVALPLTLAAGAAVLLSGRSVRPPQIQTVVMVPLRGGNPGAADDEFAAGMTAALADAIWRFGAIRIVSAGAGDASRVAAGFPGSTVVLQGIVSRGSGRLHVNAWLDDAATRRRLWSAHYDGLLSDVVSVYDDVARAIASELSTSLYPGPPPRRAVEPEAYEEYLRGRYQEVRWMAGGCPEAVRHFVRATEIDPEFANPYVEMAFCYVYPDRLERPTSETAPLARAAVARALALDPLSGAAHALSGMIRYRLDYDWQGADQEFAEAHRLEPNNPQVCIAYGEYLYTSGRIEEGLASLRRSLDLAPFAPNYNVSVGLGMLMAHRYGESVARFRRALELFPENGTALFWLVEAEARAGDRQTAARDYVAWLAMATRSTALETFAGEPLRACREGDWAACERVDFELSEAEHRQPGSVFNRPYDRFAGPSFLARRYARAGQADRAIAYLEEAYAARHHLVPNIGVDPAYDPIRQTPAFQALLDRMGIPATRP